MNPKQNPQPSKSLHVVAAVILDGDGHILIARRSLDKDMGGLWEFPGGKVESGENTTDALCRELEEELGIRPLSWQPLICIEHDYPEKTVVLDVWIVNSFSGEAYGREGQPVQWVELDALREFEFPDANLGIIEALLDREASQIL